MALVALSALFLTILPASAEKPATPDLQQQARLAIADAAAILTLDSQRVAPAVQTLGTERATRFQSRVGEINSGLSRLEIDAATMANSVDIQTVKFQANAAVSPVPGDPKILNQHIHAQAKLLHAIRAFEKGDYQKAQKHAQAVEREILRQHSRTAEQPKPVKD
jgi:hypothetical protein